MGQTTQGRRIRQQVGDRPGFTEQEIGSFGHTGMERQAIHARTCSEGERGRPGHTGQEGATGQPLDCRRDRGQARSHSEGEIGK